MEIRTEAAQFLFWESINRNFFAVKRTSMLSPKCKELTWQDYLNLEEGLVAPCRAERADIAGLLEVGAHNVNDGHHGRGYAAPHP